MSALLEGRVAVVTGGASGIGLASVERFVEHGARVVLADIDDDAAGRAVDRLGDAVVYQHTDVTSDEDVARAVTVAADHFGQLDVFFNNAGAGGDPAPLSELEVDGLDRTLALLVRSVVLGHKHAFRQFQRQRTGGSVISTASAAALQGGWSAAGYTTSKHAVLGVVRQAAAEFGASGVRSNAVCPGIIMTPIMAKAFGVPVERAEEFTDFITERLGAAQPLGRVGQPGDIADAALFLASDLSSFMTGSSLVVDGGATSVILNGFSADMGRVAEEFLDRS